MTKWIGTMVEDGTSTILRQTLIGREYAIVDQESLVPHPTFLVSVLHRRHADRAHLATTVVADEVFAHAYCTPDRNDAVTVTVSNPNASMAVVELTVKGRRITDAEQWSVAAELTATEATINGVPAGADGSIPDEPGDAVSVRGGVARVEVPANGVAVVVAALSGTASGCARRSVPRMSLSGKARYDEHGCGCAGT